MIVLVPRAVLALFAFAREKVLERRIPISLEEPYFERILRAHRGERALVRVVPYAYHLGPAGRRGLETLLARFYGHEVDVSLADAIDYGDEDDLPRDVVSLASRCDLVVTLFNLATTPESENHGVMVRAVAERAGPRTPSAVWIDEATFRARFAGNEARLAERRHAWKRMLEPFRVEPIFVDLESPDVGAIEPSLSHAIGRMDA